MGTRNLAAAGDTDALAPLKIVFYGVAYRHRIDFESAGGHDPQRHLGRQKASVVDMVHRHRARLVAEVTDTRAETDVLLHRPGLSYLLRRLAVTEQIDAVAVDLETAALRTGEVTELQQALRTHGVQLWAPRLGPIDLSNPVHALYLRICF
ncbi:hypothetical protein [Actinomadura rupiterrae]|uniref:hypothetical protein n=1 Tax=Actinomadura rupiterrae TaxID=559627 RepID=UPI0020A56F6D|nr:hypothetical protein [Actinomadura rupiterrae]MCP2341995.1 hypothetical protein [Actinomadura rupiterrae]